MLKLEAPLPSLSLPNSVTQYHLHPDCQDKAVSKGEMAFSGQTSPGGKDYKLSGRPLYKLQVFPSLLVAPLIAVEKRCPLALCAKKHSLLW